MKTTLCECDGAGYCPRHKVTKSLHWFELCQERPDYFQLWEEGRGPGQQQLPIYRVPCKWRGAHIRGVACPTCRGHVTVKVFSCERHGECTIINAVPEVTACVHCADYSAADM
jgi:hypothetical protein